MAALNATEPREILGGRLNLLPVADLVERGRHRSVLSSELGRTIVEVVVVIVASQWGRIVGLHHGCRCVGDNGGLRVNVSSSVFVNN